MGNCTGKPKVAETNLAPEPAKEETKTEGEATEIVEQANEAEVGGEATKVVSAEEQEARSLGVLFKEVKETTDDKTEAETVVAEPAKEEVKAETTTAEPSPVVDDAAKVAEPVKEEVKAEEPAAVVAPTEAAAPAAAVETVKSDDNKTETVSTEAPKTEAAPAPAPAVEKPTQVATDKPVEVLPVSSTEKAAAEPST